MDNRACRLDISILCFSDAATKHIDFGFRVARVARRLRQAVDAELRAYADRALAAARLCRPAGDGVRQKELATALAIEGPSLVRLLDSLERRGLIERREEETIAGRAASISPAPAATSPRVWQSGTEIQARLLTSVPPAELETCQRVLDGIERALDERLDMAAPLQV